MQRLILRNFQSPGDIVMLTAAVRDLHCCYPGWFQTDVRTSAPALWENNPYLSALDESDRRVRVIDCQYPLVHRSNRSPYHFVHGFTEYLNTTLDLQVAPTAFRGDIHLGAHEKQWPSQVEVLAGGTVPYWIVVAGGKRDYTIKWWEPRRFQEVVDHFKDRLLFVQVGEAAHQHPPLSGVVDLRGRTDLRQLVRLVHRAQGVVCPVTLLMHLAAAVESPDGSYGRPCVVVAGGREPPSWEAYPHHQFLHTVGALDCCRFGGCWRARTSPLGDGDEKDGAHALCLHVTGNLPRCMDLITSGDVIGCIEKYLAGGAAKGLSGAEGKTAEAAIQVLSGGLIEHEAISERPAVTICVLTYGNHPQLARRCIDSIRHFCRRSEYRLVVGANAVGRETQEYLERLHASGEIDQLHLSVHNLNKCPMMRRMLRGLDTEFVWWFDDDAYITSSEALRGRVQRARRSPPSVVVWGHRFFMAALQDFARGADVAGFIRSASWYRGRELPCANAATGRLNGDGEGRWFFPVGCSWFMRARALRELDWPDPRLIKCAEDILMGEAIRQQGWEMEDIGALGVVEGYEERRGDGEGARIMRRQMEARMEGAGGRGREASAACRALTSCLLLPVRGAPSLLEENWAGQRELIGKRDVFVVDTNTEESLRIQVKELCRREGWSYCSAFWDSRDDARMAKQNFAPWNRTIWRSLLSLGQDYHVVVKAEPAACLRDPAWFAEFGQLLDGPAAMAGSPEYRSRGDVAAFWEWAAAIGYCFQPGASVLHLQGGLYAVNAAALQRLQELPFWDAAHSFADDCYISYACQLLDIPRYRTWTVASWWPPYRPSSGALRKYKALHPWKRGEDTAPRNPAMSGSDE